MTTIERYAIDLVQRVIGEREVARKAPLVASLRDITATATAEITAALESLAQQGFLRKTENLNKIPMYIPKDSDA